MQSVSLTPLGQIIYNFTVRTHSGNRLQGLTMYTRHSVDLVAGLAESPMIATKHTVIVFFLQRSGVRWGNWKQYLIG
jgi:hypothetical protein